MIRSLTARTILALVVAVGLASCGCREDEVDSVEACTLLTDALAQAFTQCQLDTSPASALCLASCGDDCLEKADVEACRTAILALGCGGLSVQAVELLDTCRPVLEDIAELDCRAHDDDDEDDLEDLFD